MNLYQVIVETIDMRSFSNLWYWIMLAVMWSSASHWVLGVPFDMISRARRHGGKAQDDLETLVRINVERLLGITQAAGTWLIGLLFFFISALAMLAGYYGIEFAQAVLFLFVPLSLLGLLSWRSAGLIAAGENTGDSLHRRLSRHRISIQALGVVSIFFTSMFGMWVNMHVGVFG